ncbi:MAG: type I-B CRISPR-associated protein Cas8b1/Cst1 [Nitrospirae bacterium]|nr:type I-B CRISPR-associated protein Cas8b1/Cst1 [Nitrospirota bacterium]
MAIFRWTGNPWVDAGISVIQEWNGKDRPEMIGIDDMREVSGALLDVYLSEAWRKNLYSVFPNNPVTNPSVKNKKERLEAFLKDLIDGIAPEGRQGNCMACGRRDALSGKNRMHIPLTGYEGSHFFSYKADGADYCEACTFAVQCSPLMYYSCGKLLLLHSNSDRVMKYWTRRCLSEVNRQIASRKFTGCFDEKYTNPTNALFHIIQDLILTYDEQWTGEDASIRMYHFTNYNQGPDLAIYDLPSPVFRFLSYVRQHRKYPDWCRVVRRGYANARKKGEDEYRNSRNTVFTALMNGQSILRCFYDTGNKSVVGDWSLVRFYVKEVLSMNEKRIETIRRLGDDIAEIIRTSGNGRRRLGQLERAQNYADFRSVLLRLMRDSVALKADRPLFSFDDYSEYLFPDGAMGWKETLDLLLFRLYEVLHGWLVSEGVVVEESDDVEEGEEVGA